jgi:hypothetical protein
VSRYQTLFATWKRHAGINRPEEGQEIAVRPVDGVPVEPVEAEGAPHLIKGLPIGGIERHPQRHGCTEGRDEVGRVRCLRHPVLKKSDPEARARIQKDPLSRGEIAGECSDLGRGSRSRVAPGDPVTPAHPREKGGQDDE